MPLPSLSQKLVHLFLSLVALTLVTVTASSLDNVNQQTVFVLAATTIVGVALVRATKLPEDTSREKMSSLVWLERAFGLAGSCAWSSFLLLRLLASPTDTLSPWTLLLCVATTLLTVASFFLNAYATASHVTKTLPVYDNDAKSDPSSSVLASGPVAELELTLVDTTLDSIIGGWSATTLLASSVLVFLLQADRFAGVLLLPSALSLLSVFLSRRCPSLLSGAIFVQTYATLSFNFTYASYTLPACRSLAVTLEPGFSSFGPSFLACTLSNLTKFASRLVLGGLIVRVAVGSWRGESRRTAAAEETNALIAVVVLDKQREDASSD